MRVHPVLWLCVAVAWSALPAGAAGGSFYLTTKLASTSVEHRLELGPFDTFEEDEQGWSVGAGYGVSPRLALQAEYLTFGSVTQTRACGPPETLCLSAPPLETEISALSASVVARLPLGSRASAFGKAGLARLETEASSLGSRESSSDQLEGHLGVGLSLTVGPRVSLLAEYDSIGGDVDSLSIGASYEF